MMKRLLWLLPLLVLAAGAYFYGTGTPLPWQEAAAPAADGADRQRPPKAVAVAEAAETTLVDRLQASGTVRARESVTVTSEASGIVKAVLFAHGAQVADGEALVRLDDTEARAEVSAARADLTAAERAYDRARQLRQNGTIAQGPYDDARAALEQARTDLALAEEALRKRTVRAPFAGRAGFREISPGAYLTPGDQITTLDDIAAVYVDFAIPEARLPEVQPGQTVGLSTAARPGVRREGTVLTIAPRVDPVSRQARVRAEVPNEDATLRPGQLVTVAVATRTRPALMVPASAVIAVGYQHFAFVVGEDDTVTRRTVEIGTRTADSVEITSGVAPGERIVIEGAGKLNGGDRIRVVEPLAVTAETPPAET